MNELINEDLQETAPVANALDGVQPVDPVAPLDFSRLDQPAVITDQFVPNMLMVADKDPGRYAKANALSRQTGMPATDIYDNPEQAKKLEVQEKASIALLQAPKLANILGGLPSSQAAAAQQDLGPMAKTAEAATRPLAEDVGEGEMWSQLADTIVMQRVQAFNAQKAFHKQQKLQAMRDGTYEAPVNGRAAGLGLTQELPQETEQDLQAQITESLGHVAETTRQLGEQPEEQFTRDYQAGRDQGQGFFDALTTSLSDNPVSAYRTLLTGVGTSAEVIAGTAAASYATGGLPLVAAAVGYGLGFNLEESFTLMSEMTEAGVDTSKELEVLKFISNPKLATEAMKNARQRAAVVSGFELGGAYAAAFARMPKNLAYGVRGSAQTAASPLPFELATIPLNIGDKTRIAGNIGLTGAAAAGMGGAGEYFGDMARGEEAGGLDILMEAAGGLATAPADIAIYGGKQSWMRFATGLKRANQSRISSETQDQMIAGAMESNLRTQDPQGYREIMAGTLAGTPNEYVWIPADAIRTLNQDGKLESSIENTPGMRESLADAEMTGGAVVISNADYLTYFADYHAELGSRVRANADALSTEEADLWSEMEEQRITELVADAKANEQNIPEYRKLVDMLQSAGVPRAESAHVAALHLQTMQTMAKRNNTTVEEIANTMRLGIQREQFEQAQGKTVNDLTIMLDRVRTGDIPQVQDQFGQSLGEWVISRGGLDDAGGELAALDANVGRVGKNRYSKAEGGMSIDQAAREAVDAGYFPGVAPEDISPQMIVDAIRDELGGKPRYSPAQENQSMQNIARSLQELTDHLDQQGIDIDTMTNEEVIAALTGRTTFEAEENATPEEKKAVRILNQFAGTTSLTRNGEMFVKAEQALQAGADAEAVRKLTGWFKGQDGMWRYEISDKDAVLKQDVIDGITSQKRVERAINSVLAVDNGNGTVTVTLYPKKDPVRDPMGGNITVQDVPLDKIDSVFGLTLGERVKASVTERSKKLTQGMKFSEGSSAPLGEVLDHPELFAAYPQLADIRVSVDHAQKNGGFMSTTGNQIGITIGSGEQRNTLLHEIQHALQRYENFATGGNAARADIYRWEMHKQIKALAEYERAAKDRAGVEADELAQEMLDRQTPEQRQALLDSHMARRKIAQGGDPDTVAKVVLSGGWLDETDDIYAMGFNSLEIQQLNKLSEAQLTDSPRLTEMRMQLRAADALSPYEVYHRLAGEVEARLTEARANMTDEERRATAPQYEYSNNAVIVVRGDTVTMKDPVASNVMFWDWFGSSKTVDAAGNPVVVYHGTDKAFSRVDMSKGSQGVFWFTSDRQAIEDGEVGAAGSGVIMDLYASIQNPAGWEEYDKFSIGELISRGYDGVILPEKDGTFTGFVFEPTQIKSANNKGAWSKTDPRILNQSMPVNPSDAEGQVLKFGRPVDPDVRTVQEMSVRLPGLSAEEDPLADTLALNYPLLKTAPKTLEKNVAAMKQWVNFQNIKARKPDAVLEKMIDHMVDNLLFLHDLMPADLRERSWLWYDGGNRMSINLAEHYGLSKMQMAASIAVQSPQKDWFQNVSLAERVTDIVMAMQDFTWDDRMTEVANSEIFVARREPEYTMLDQLIGKKLSEVINDPQLSARWVRTFDQAHNSRAFNILLPEGGAHTPKLTKSGSTANVAWPGFDTIAKQISILLDGRAENVHWQLGGEHKVRSFYNNISFPMSALGHATIDTHAVAAALFRPLSGNSIEVIQNFGGVGSSSSKQTGMNGIYPIIWEAYRRAAEARGMLPRQMQSITWEAVRGLFEGPKKNSISAAANGIWERYRTGEITQAQARDEMVDLAGGITAPSWAEVPFNDAPAHTYTGLSRTTGAAMSDKGRVPDMPVGIGFEVAPNPDDAALTEQWNSLPAIDQKRITMEAVNAVLPALLDDMGIDAAELITQLGGFDGYSNPSLVLKMAQSGLAVQLSQMLGYILNQKSMFIVSDEPFAGGQQKAAAVIDVTGMSDEQIDAIYQRVYNGALDKDGKRVVNGYSALNGVMAFVTDSPLSEEELAYTISDALGNEFDVGHTSVFTTEESTDANSQARRAAAGRPSTQGRIDTLRAEASRIVAEGIAGITATSAGVVPDSGGLGGSRRVLSQSNRADQGDGGKPSPAKGRQPDGSLQDLPRNVGGFVASSWEPAQRIAREYMKEAGLPYSPPSQYVKADPARGARIAEAFEAMQHNPQDPATQKAYAALIKETAAQYEAVMSTGLIVEFIKEGQADPYAGNPRAMTDDVRNNNHMWVFSTRDGFGSSELDVADNPLLGETKFEISGQTALANDLFRVVHDYFGHVKEGVGFRADGEENTWQAHAAMFSPEARKALTTETRGQNSWVNFGPHGETNRTAGPADTIYADQKVGLLPDWVVNEGRLDEKGPTVLNQKVDDSARGNISIGEANAAGVREFIITLGKRRDASTVLHELGHYYLEVMAELSGRDSATDEVKADLQAIREFLGNDGGEWTTEQHEKFARSFEAFLREGKAPTPELTTAFSHFKAWLMQIYKTLVALDTDLSPEIREVFSRMIASDEQIRDAEDQIGGQMSIYKDFAQAAAAGMTAAEWKEYQGLQAEAHEQAAASVANAMIEEQKRIRSAWWRTASKDMEDAVAEEVDLMPVYQAQKALRTGDIKLNSKQLADEYGSAARSKLAMMYAGNGLSLDIAARMLDLGYTSGDELVKALLSAPKRTELIKTLAAQRMMEAHGPLDTGEAASRAMEAVNGEAQERVISKELQMLGVAPGRKASMTKMLKETAKRIIADRKIRELEPAEYQRAEGKAARKAYESLIEGDKKAALIAKQQQLLNMYLYREAIAARERALANAKKMREHAKLKNMSKLGKAGEMYTNQMNNLLEQYEFANVPNRTLDERQSYDRWYNDQIDQGQDPFVPDFVLANKDMLNWKELTTTQLEDIRTMADNIAALARWKNELKSNKKYRDKQAAVEALRVSALTNISKRTTQLADKAARGWTEKVGEWLSKANSSLMKMEQIIEWLDGGDPDGAWNTIIWQPLNRASDHRNQLDRQVTRATVAAVDKWYKARGTTVAKNFSIPSISEPITVNGMLAVALNQGNAGNREKLLKGYEGRGWTQQTVDEILANMQKHDWDLVQELWDTANSLWPDIVALEKQVNGISPQKVDPTVVQTPFGNYAGGYWPLVYEWDSMTEMNNALGKLSPLNEKGGVRATTPQGHTKTRSNKFAAEIVLDVGVISMHLNGVIHDLTHRVVLKEVRDLLSNREVNQAMIATIGSPMAQNMKNIVDGIADDLRSGSAVGDAWWRKILTGLRNNAAKAWMGWSVTTVLNQISGYSQALEHFAKIGKRAELLRAIVKFSRNPIASMKLVQEMSPMMLQRASTLDVTMRDATEKLMNLQQTQLGAAGNAIKKSTYDRLVDNAFLPLLTVQKLVDTPVWMAAYEAHGGAMNHQESVDFADKTVRMSQMGAEVKDLAAIQHSDFMKYFIPVYSYSNALWNRNWDIAKQAWKGNPKDVAVAFERFIYVNMFPALLAAAIKGKWPDEDDEPEEYAALIAVETLLSMTSGVPIVRDMAASLNSPFAYGGLSPFGGGLAAGLAMLKGSDSATNAVTAVGMLTGLPSVQTNRAVKAWDAYENGEIDDLASWEFIDAVLRGPKK